MTLKDLTDKLTVWGDWRSSYNKHIPNFIEEAKAKEWYSDWDFETFKEFFETARNQCVSSLQQGYFSNAEKKALKNDWAILAPLLKEIAESQDSMKLDVYREIDKNIRKHTTQHRRAATNRLIASLQPQLLCTIVNHHKLHQLMDMLNANVEGCHLQKTNNWYKDSNAVLNYYVNELGKEHKEIVTLPWQTYVYLLDNTIDQSESNFMDDEETTNNDQINDKQVILYGPPGTGKTYHTIERALSIVDKDYNCANKPRIEVAEHFRSLIYDEKTNPDGQIIFTTFHQSMTYEDFIEGIKPKLNYENDDSDTEAENSSNNDELEYEIKDGLFKTLVGLANKSTKATISFENLWSKYIEQLKAETGEKTFTSISSELKLDSLEPQGNSINVRFKKSWNPDEPEGTRAFIVSKNMIERLFSAKVDGSLENKNGRTDVSKLVGKGRATHIYAVYKDFYSFAIDQRAFDKAEQLNYVMIIDEINRGNVSSIFGELITLIEPDKRKGEENELSVTLPYSREKFVVPKNLYIIGTMNTADRSVEALDTALRRRFTFEEMLPKPELVSPSAMFSRLMWKYKKVDWEEKTYKGKETDLKMLFKIFKEKVWDERKVIWQTKMYKQDESVLTHLSILNEHSPINFQELLEVMNRRIQVLIDRDHTIGHAYFINIENVNDLKKTFNNKIIPLLQEYFYGDYKKMEMVIGSYFFEQSKRKQLNDLFAVVQEPYDADTSTYELRDIYDEDFDIQDAIEVMLRKKTLEEINSQTED